MRSVVFTFTLDPGREENARKISESMAMRLVNFVLAVVLACIVAACGRSSSSDAKAGASSTGGGAGAPPQENGGLTRVVSLSWTPNRESGVNSAGGGYEIAIGGATTIDVPYTADANAPTAIEVPLEAGTYAV